MTDSGFVYTDQLEHSCGNQSGNIRLAIVMSINGVDIDMIAGYTAPAGQFSTVSKIFRPILVNIGDVVSFRTSAVGTISQRGTLKFCPAKTS